MASEFALAGYLDIIGFRNVDRAVNDLTRQLSSLPPFQVAGIDKVPAQAKAATSNIKSLNREIIATATAAQDFGDKAGLALRRFTAFSIAAGATFGSLRLIGGGLKQAALFERELIKVQQVSNASTKSIANLRDEINRLGISLAAPAAELVKVSTTLAQAGLSVNETKVILESLARTKLAATFGSIENTTEGVIAVMGQFGVKANQVDDALALISATAAGFAVESEQIISAIRRTGGVFAAASSGVDQGTAALAKFNALFTSVIQTTRQAPESVATGLRTIIARLQRPQSVEFFKNIGIELRDLEGKFVGPFNAIQRIGQALDNLDPRSSLFTEAVEVIGGARQLGVVVPLIKEWRLQQEILNKSLQDQGRFISDSELPLKTLVERFVILSNQWQKLSRDVFNTPTFQIIANQALELAGALVRVADSVSSLIPIFAALGAIKVGAGIAAGLPNAINRFRTGDFLGVHRASGGYIPGFGVGDKEVILAEPGEFVIRRNAAKKLGPDFLNKINNADRFAMGGYIGGRKVKGYADGGEIDTSGRGFDTSGREFNDLRKEFRNIAKELGFTVNEFNKLTNEIRGMAGSVSESRKLFEGAITSVKRYSKSSENTPGLSGGGVSGGNIGRLLSEERARISGRQSLVKPSGTDIYTGARGPGIIKERILGSGVISTNKVPQLLLEDKRNRTLAPLGRGGGRGVYIPPRLSTLGSPVSTNKQLLLEDLSRADQPGISNKKLKNRRAYGATVDPETVLKSFDERINRTSTDQFGNVRTYNEDQRGALNRVVRSRLAESRRARESSNYGGIDADVPRKLNAEYVASSALRGLDPSKSTTPLLSPLTTDLEDFSTNKYKSIEYSQIGEPKPLSYWAGRSFAATKNRVGNSFIGRRVGQGISGISRGTLKFGRGIAGGNSFALGGAAVLNEQLGGPSAITGALGGAAAGGALGGPLGAIAGGVAGGVTARVQDTLRKEQEQINTKLAESSKKLEDAFNDLSNNGVKKLDKLLSERFDITAQQQKIGSRGPLDSFIAGLAGLEDLEAKKKTTTNTGPGKLSDQNAVGSFQRDTFFQTPYNYLSADIREDESAKAVAETNRDVAEQARKRIKDLVSKGNTKGITGKLLEASVSDDSNLLQGTRIAREVEGKRRAGLFSPNLNKRSELSGQSYKRFDELANRIGKTISLFDAFNVALANSSNELDNNISVAKGEFKINRSFVNPFDAIQGLNKNQILSSIGGLENFLGTSFSKESKDIAGSIPLVSNLTEILNKEFERTGAAGSSSDVANVIRDRSGPLKGLGKSLRKDLINIFDAQSDADTKDLLAGDNTEILGKLDKVTGPMVEAFKKTQDGANELAKTLQAAANERSTLVAQIGKFNQSLVQNATAAKNFRISNSGNLIRPEDAIRDQLNGIRALTGQNNVQPDAILNRMNQLLADRSTIEGGTDPRNGQSLDLNEQNRLLSDNNAELINSKEALQQLTDSSAVLSAVQAELADIDKRRAAVNSIIQNDVLGGDPRKNFKADLAFQQFQKGSLRDVAATNLSKDDLQAGINRERERISAKGSPEELKAFDAQIGRKLNNDPNAGLSQADVASNNAFFDQKDKREGELNNIGDKAFENQGLALQAQRELLGKSIIELDKVINSTFVNGVNNLREVAQTLKIPETISVEVKDFSLTVTAPDFKQLDPYFKTIAEDVVKKALKDMTEGRSNSPNVGRRG